MKKVKIRINSASEPNCKDFYELCKSADRLDLYEKWKDKVIVETITNKQYSTLQETCLVYNGTFDDILEDLISCYRNGIIIDKNDELVDYCITLYDTYVE